MKSLEQVTMELIDVYDRLYGRFGPQRWWPQSDGAFEVIVGAILTQNTTWTNVEKALTMLKSAKLLTPDALNRVSQKRLAELIRPSGYFNLKTKKLKAFVRFLFEKHDGKISHLFKLEIADLREELLTVYGVGPETADSILLYAAGKPSFVVDAYTRRILARLGLIPENASYDQTQRLFMQHLPHDEQMFNEYHALIVALGKDICKKSKPKCAKCPLSMICVMRLEMIRTRKG